MCELTIKQPGYNNVRFEFDDMTSAAIFVEEARKHCTEDTEFILTHNVVAPKNEEVTEEVTEEPTEQEEGEEDESF